RWHRARSAEATQSSMPASSGEKSYPSDVRAETCTHSCGSTSPPARIVKTAGSGSGSGSGSVSGSVGGAGSGLVAAWLGVDAVADPGGASSAAASQAAVPAVAAPATAIPGGGSARWRGRATVLHSSSQYRPEEGARAAPPVPGASSSADPYCGSVTTSDPA